MKIENILRKFAVRNCQVTENAKDFEEFVVEL